jgi:hypothetical protein
MTWAIRALHKFNLCAVLSLRYHDVGLKLTAPSHVAATEVDFVQLAQHLRSRLSIEDLGV